MHRNPGILLFHSDITKFSYVSEVKQSPTIQNQRHRQRFAADLNIPYIRFLFKTMNYNNRASFVIQLQVLNVVISHNAKFFEF